MSYMTRSMSAYDNTLTTVDDEELVGIPSSSSFQDAFDVNGHFIADELLEINLEADDDQIEGFGFQLVGNRSRGVFISYVYPESTHSKYLKEGDRIVSCEKSLLRGMSIDQVACILRYWLAKLVTIRLGIERRHDGPREMCERRRQERLSMHIDQRENNLGTMTTTFRMSASKSHEAIRSTAASFWSNDSSLRDRRKLTSLNRKHYLSFDDTPSVQSVCPQCKTRTKMMTLHQFSHGILEGACRLLTSRSDYSLL